MADHVDSDTRPTEAVPFQQPFSHLPASSSSSSQGEAYPPGIMTDVYPAATGPALYPSGSAAMQSQMMVGHGRDFNQTGDSGFELEDPGKVFHPSQGTWQPALGSEPGHPSAGIPPPSLGMAPQGDFRPPEFHPNLESGAPQAPHEGNLPS